MTLVSTGIRWGGILPRAVLGCYEWTFVLEQLLLRSGRGYLQVNLCFWQALGQACPSFASSLAPSLVRSAHRFQSQRSLFGCGGPPVLGPHPRWGSPWWLSADRWEVKDICLQNGPGRLCRQRCSHHSDAAGVGSGLRRCPGSSAVRTRCTRGHWATACQSPIVLSWGFVTLINSISIFSWKWPVAMFVLVNWTSPIKLLEQSLTCSQHSPATTLQTHSWEHGRR